MALDHLGFAAESAEESQSWADCPESCNVAHSGVRGITVGGTESVGAMLDFRDPDGIQLEFLFRDTAKIRRLPACTPS
jgi:hypothetical protein